LLQELHFYENGEHLKLGSIAERLGWAMLHSPATRQDPSRGVKKNEKKESDLASIAS
jgi:hypothetical protein